jgi:hypothetical protein
MIKPYRRMWGGTKRQTRWRVTLKVGTQPWGVGWIAPRPVAGKRGHVWRDEPGAKPWPVIVDRVEDGRDPIVFCTLW